MVKKRKYLTPPALEKIANRVEIKYPSSSTKKLNDIKILAQTLILFRRSRNPI